MAMVTLITLNRKVCLTKDNFPYNSLTVAVIGSTQATLQLRERLHSLVWRLGGSASFLLYHQSTWRRLLRNPMLWGAQAYQSLHSLSVVKVVVTCVADDNHCLSEGEGILVKARS